MTLSSFLDLRVSGSRERDNNPVLNLSDARCGPGSFLRRFPLFVGGDRQELMWAKDVPAPGESGSA